MRASATEKRFGLGKRGLVSALDVSQMLASGDHRGMGKLGAEGLDFARRCQDDVERELDHLAR